MANSGYYRGGRNLTPRPGDIRIDLTTGLLRTTHGISVFDRPDGLDRFGGVYQLGPIPSTLRVLQRGKDPHHFEIVPAHPMTLVEYETELAQITLTPV